MTSIRYEVACTPSAPDQGEDGKVVVGLGGVQQAPLQLEAGSSCSALQRGGHLDRGKCVHIGHHVILDQAGTAGTGWPSARDKSGDEMACEAGREAAPIQITRRGKAHLGHGHAIATQCSIAISPSEPENGSLQASRRRGRPVPRRARAAESLSGA